MMMPSDQTAWLDPVTDALVARGVFPAGGAPTYDRLTGGVSSDIWRITKGERSAVVKRALPKLRVAQDWQAPVERNGADADWLRTVRGIVPEAVPEVLYEDRAAGLFAMSYIEPSRAPVWKAELFAGRVDPDFAREVGRIVGRVHAATAGRGEIAERFPNASMFRALRLSPYLEATAARHPGLQERIAAILRDTEANQVCLIHGDVSPKNILVGADGPIILDAECATYGDPAFDLAFCLNHLLLKRVPATETAPLAISFEALTAGYFEGVGSMADSGIERRAAALLPALLLARIDGKSPVEYITAEPDRQLVRDFAIPLIRSAPPWLETINAGWEHFLAETGR